MAKTLYESKNNVMLSESQIEALVKSLQGSIKMCLEVLDYTYEDWLTGRLSNTEYSKRLKIWEDRYFEVKDQLQKLNSAK